MKCISFDVGIKNMAYCIFTINEKGLNINDWNVINLIESTETKKQLCNYVIENKTKKKIETKICEKKGKYIKNNCVYCETHAKKSGFIMPTKTYGTTSLKKLKVAELVSLAKKHFIFQDKNKNSIDFLNKKDVLDLLEEFFKNKMLETITVKKNNASEVDLITIGIAIKNKLDNLDTLDGLTHVIIENQISPIANRMKTIQGMLSQYFIMRAENIENLKIDFISSSNKLKDFEKGGENSYKQHKKDSVIITNNFLENNIGLQKWISSMNTNKKDDLADCFLQGIWYLKNKKKIQYNDYIISSI
jgi:hypothetical protein